MGLITCWSVKVSQVSLGRRVTEKILSFTKKPLIHLLGISIQSMDLPKSITYIRNNN